MPRCDGSARLASQHTAVVVHFCYSRPHQAGPAVPQADSSASSNREGILPYPCRLPKQALVNINKRVGDRAMYTIGWPIGTRRMHLTARPGRVCGVSMTASAHAAMCGATNKHSSNGHDRRCLG